MADYTPFKHYTKLGTDENGRGSEFTVFYKNEDNKKPKLIKGPQKDRISFSLAAYQGKAPDDSYNKSRFFGGLCFSPAANGLAENVTHGNKIEVTKGKLVTNTSSDGTLFEQIIVEDFVLKGNNTSNTPVTASANKPVSQGLPPGVTY